MSQFSMDGLSVMKNETDTTIRCQTAIVLIIIISKRHVFALCIGFITAEKREQISLSVSY